MRAALLLLLAGCGAPPVEWPAEAGARAYSAPLVEAWHVEQPLVEVTLGDRGPFLFVLDTAQRATLAEPVARALDLPIVGTPERGRTARATQVGLGDLTLPSLAFDLVDRPDLGLLHERPVVGALGLALLDDAALEIDRQGGRLRILRGDAPLPLGAREVPLERLKDGRRHLTARIGGHEVPGLLLATGERLNLLRADAARTAGLSPLPFSEAWRGTLELGGDRQEAGFLPVGGGHPDLAGALGFPALGGRSFRLQDDRLWLWDPPDARDHLARFGDLPDCGRDFSRCVQGVITRVEPGRVWLAFRRPEVPLPPRYWARINLGFGDAGHAVLVRLDPRPRGLLTTSLEDAAFGPDTLRPRDTPLPVVDLVPLGVPCPGDVCVRR